LPSSTKVEFVTNNKLYWYIAVGGLRPPPSKYCLLEFITNNKLYWYFAVGGLCPPPPKYYLSEFFSNNKLYWYFAVGGLRPPPPKYSLSQIILHIAIDHKEGLHPLSVLHPSKMSPI